MAESRMAESRNDGADVERIAQTIQRWADGRATLKDVRGYSDQELFAVARTGYAFFNQGKIAEARTIFQGLFAINPREAYFARALAVVEQAAGNADGALSAYDVAVKLAPEDPMAYIGRAEIRILKGQTREALQDLQAAMAAKGEGKRLKSKAKSLFNALRQR
jgi:type III secretion system low calcium response chaperone LcrH/SycD